MEAQRLAALKTRLASLRYDQALGLETAPLVERLLEDLVKSQQRQAELPTKQVKTKTKRNLH